MKKMTLTQKMMAAVFLGIIGGYLLPQKSLVDWVPLGKMMINWVKLMAGPLLFFTVAQSLMEVQVERRQAFKLIGVALLNTTIALVIGLSLVSLVGAENLMPKLAHASAPAVESVPSQKVHLSGLIQTLSPQSLLEPFVKNDVLLIALMALLFGLGARTLLHRSPDEYKSLERFFNAGQKLSAQMLTALVQIMPLAVLIVIAGSVNEYGIEIFKKLGAFVALVCVGFLLQILIVYQFWIIQSGRKLSQFWRVAKEPLLYCIGVNSSLATLPLTLRALDQLGVSKKSASLGAGVATNLNNDGIILYEASAALLVGLAAGYTLGLPDMVTVALTCLIAALGITGVPEAGFISLSVVVTTLGYPTEYLPLLLTVDWFLARARTVVNVTSDMTLAVSIDGKVST